ncbi:MAG: SMI1/KNR4 family protein [Gemmataceae bacterium]|nr:SMI1/KNR4 family protein [Gemmataceae bacterium]
MDEGYMIRHRIPGAIPIGDDGGGQVIFYAQGRDGFGLYHVGYGNLDIQDAKYIAPSLSDFLSRNKGIDSF